MPAPDEIIEDIVENKEQNAGHHKAVLRSLKKFAQLLDKYPKLSVFSLTLLIEYYLIELGIFINIFKKVIFNGVEVDSVDFWLGHSNLKIKYHALVCQDFLKQQFFEKLTAWENAFTKSTEHEHDTKRIARRKSNKRAVLDE